MLPSSGAVCGVAGSHEVAPGVTHHYPTMSLLRGLGHVTAIHQAQLMQDNVRAVATMKRISPHLQARICTFTALPSHMAQVQV